MTREELNTFEDSLVNRGYRRWTTCKTSMRSAYEWMKTIDGVIIAFRVWEFSKYGPSNEPYGIDIRIVDSNDGTRVDLNITNPELDIDRTEEIAKAFLKFNQDNVYT